MRRGVVWSLAGALAGLALVACSSSSGAGAGASEGADSGLDATAGQTVGAAGGSVSGAGVKLDVPAGALSSDTVLTIGPSSDPVPSGYTALSQVFAFGPDGTTFTKPVTVTFDVANADATTTVFWSNPAGGYQALPTTVTATSVSAKVTHFSRGFCGHGGGGGGSSGAASSGGSSGGTGSGGSSGGSSGANASSSSGSGSSGGGADASSSGGGADASSSSSGGNADGGPSLGIFVDIGGVPAAFTSHMVSGGPVQPYPSMFADDNPSPTHWTMSISVTNQALTLHCSPNVTLPAITYTHYTASGDAGVIDQQYTTTPGIPDAGGCTIASSTVVTVPGQIAQGSFSGTLVEVTGDAGPPTYPLTGGTYALPYP